MSGAVGRGNRSRGKNGIVRRSINRVLVYVTGGGLLRSGINGGTDGIPGWKTGKKDKVEKGQ